VVALTHNLVLFYQHCPDQWIGAGAALCPTGKLQGTPHIGLMCTAHKKNPVSDWIHLRGTGQAKHRLDEQEATQPKTIYPKENISSGDIEYSQPGSNPRS
jgi:hypothetical protein